jgi:uncharacterized protein
MNEKSPPVRNHVGHDAETSMTAGDSIRYHGVIPACTSCARCCHQVVDLVEGIDRVPEAWVVEHGGLRCMDQRADGACVALDPVTRLCTIYENRPTVCREFERGGELCRQVLARHERRHLG